MPMDDELSSPITCPNTITIRRNPPRRARPTPSKPLTISSFPLTDILSINLPPQTTTTTVTDTDTASISDPDSVSLKVFLRVRPPNKTGVGKGKVPKLKRDLVVKSCIVVNDFNSVTVTPPVCDSSRLKSEVYAGFSHVFDPHSSQNEVYDKMMRPIVEEFLNGRSGLLAALGPSGSGKTHTVFGSAKEPGLVPRALRHIFNTEVGITSISSRSFYLSVFEISMEKGKGEKLSDLSPDGGDVHMQQSAVKGLKEVLIKDVTQAEAILAGAKLKRATAMTNSNSQSSRSQCIINIRCTTDEAERESEAPLSGTRLTFVDLAGAERERKTGNQGGRLLESNFINNTSMVLGLCLRSLLEHQKNPKKPLQKHFQSSLLTRYLRDYLEGRKRMALILTARSGPEDYFDVSFLLRQASPYMEIKFQNTEDTSKLPCNKRPNQTACSDKLKRMKLCNADEKDDVEQRTMDSSNYSKEETAGVSNAVKGDKMLGIIDSELAEVNNSNAKLQREYYVMQRFAEAFWNALKKYKERVKVMQKEIDLLTENISTGHDRYLALEKEFHDLKSRCSCPKQLPINNVCSVEGTTQASRVSVVEELTDYEKIASAKVQGVVAFECQKKPVLYSAIEQCSLNSDQEPAGLIAPEEQPKFSASKCEAFSLSEEKDDCNRFVVEIIETSISEAGCALNNFETIPPQHEDSQGKFKFSAPPALQNGLVEIQDLGTSVVHQAHIDDSPSPTKTFAFVDGKTEQDTNSRTPIEGVELLSCDFESSVQQNYQICAHLGDSPSPTKTFTVVNEKTQHDAILRMPVQGAVLSRDLECSLQQKNQAQCSAVKSEISRGKVCLDDYHEKDPENNDTILTDASVHLPNSDIMDLKIERENNGSNTNEKKDKGNVTNTPRSNFNSKLKVTDTSLNPMKAERPKRRLMPASSLLLRDAGSLDVADDSVKRRGGRVGQRIAEDDSKRSRGNASLLRLLNNHLPR